MNNIRMANDRLEDEASTDFSEISEDENQTSNTIRSLRIRAPNLGDILSRRIVEFILNVTKNTRI